SHGFSGTEPLDDRISRVSLELQKSVLVAPRLELDGDDEAEFFPRVIANQIIDGELFVIGRLGKTQPKNVTLVGNLDGEAVRMSHRLAWPSAREAQNPLLSRLFAEARIAELDRATDEASKRRIREISADRHVLSRDMSLIALESEAMFEEHGIARTQKH